MAAGGSLIDRAQDHLDDVVRPLDGQHVARAGQHPHRGAGPGCDEDPGRAPGCEHVAGADEHGGRQVDRGQAGPQVHAGHGQQAADPRGAGGGVQQVAHGDGVGGHRAGAE